LAKLLAERHGLTKELNTLKAEVEDLRCQLNHQTATISEKQALERQLNMVEVELENVKRARARAMQKDGVQESDEELLIKLNAAEKNLADEKRARELLAREAAKTLSQANADRDAAELKLERLRAKLRETQAELKNARAEIATSKNPMATLTDDTVTTIVANSKIGKKRRANQISSDDHTVTMAIQTPPKGAGKAKRGTKKRGADLTLVEKSTFSITPFLNRTRTISDESLIGTSNDEKSSTDNTTEVLGDDSLNDREKPGLKPSLDLSVRPAKGVRKLDAKPRGRPRIKPLAEQSLSKTNMPANRKKASAKSLLPVEEVPEEIAESRDQENLLPSPQVTDEKITLKLKIRPDQSRDSGDSLSTTDPEPKKKKRKLLGAVTTTLFDDDEAEATKRPAKPVGGMRRTLSKAPLGSKSGISSSSVFSPLKRDRRGIHASFLA
jgi:hypothetical protein